MNTSDLQLENLDMQFLHVDAEPELVLSIRALNLRVTLDGLQKVIASLVPDQPLQVTIDNQPNIAGCTLTLQALKWGLAPRVFISLEPFGSLSGSILINLRPGSRWSMIDRTMLAIATHNLNRIARKQPEVQRLGSQSYRLELQGLIRERLMDSGAPVRWDARLEQIRGTPADIRVEFVSSADEDGTA